MSDANWFQDGRLASEAQRRLQSGESHVAVVADLLADNERLMQRVNDAEAAHGRILNRMGPLRAQRDRLREALQSVADEFGGVLATAEEHDFAVAARAALADTEGEG